MNKRISKKKTGRPPKPASELTGNHMDTAKKNQLIRLEAEAAGPKETLKKGIEGLTEAEKGQFVDDYAIEMYKTIQPRIAEVSSTGDISISTIIALSNEYSYLKIYNEAMKEGPVIFHKGKPIANPADKMRKESLRTIDMLKDDLGIKAVDIISQARAEFENSEAKNLANLFSAPVADDSWED